MIILVSRATVGQMKLDMLQTFGSAQNEEGAFCVLAEFVEADGDELLASGVAYVG